MGNQYTEKLWSYSIYIYEKCYVHNIFTVLSQQIISGRMLQDIIGEKRRSNFRGRFK